jgi:hypothetical protein
LSDLPEILTAGFLALNQSWYWKSTNQKQELSVAAMFAKRSGRN